ncbi:uncharacterized protein LOC118162546 [Oxyura jamaicensis]|uniref:uncharacterized protein LOC118162546 n=1 Tax=Oxyura jamaicensis TaxID=8884 RepID=UPI0015A4FF20|nr:uncharacterized protein LOC118162546 [Oxyura jamaicensis]
MAEKADVPRDEEEMQNNSEEDPFPICGVVTASPGCSASLFLASLNEDKGSSVVPERLSVLSSKAVAQAKALAGPEISGSQAQSRASGLAKYQLTAANAPAGGLSYPLAVCKPKPADITSLCSESLCCNCNQGLEVPHAPEVSKVAGEPPEAVKNIGCCHMQGASKQYAGNGTKGIVAPCSLGLAIWMKTTKVMENLENKKKEEKEKYRLQLAMYRRLLLLRSIRSLHKQLEQQQARLQECYGMVINTKKEVLKRIRSTSPSPSP